MLASRPAALDIDDGFIALAAKLDAALGLDLADFAVDFNEQSIALGLVFVGDLERAVEGAVDRPHFDLQHGLVGIRAGLL